VAGAVGAVDEGSVFDEEQVWYIADAIPEGMSRDRGARASLGHPAARRDRRVGWRAWPSGSILRI